MNPDTDTTTELEEVEEEEEDPDSGDAYEVSYFTNRNPSVTITKKEFGDPWIINIPKNEVTYLSFYPSYKHNKFPHIESKLGVLTTFRPIHYDEHHRFYLPGHEGHQFYHTTPIGKYELRQLIPSTSLTTGFHSGANDQYFYMASVDYLTLEETNKEIETGMTIANV
jgi:hypothetical protein